MTEVTEMSDMSPNSEVLVKKLVRQVHTSGIMAATLTRELAKGLEPEDFIKFASAVLLVRQAIQLPSGEDRTTMLDAFLDAYSVDTAKLKSAHRALEEVAQCVTSGDREGGEAALSKAQKQLSAHAEITSNKTSCRSEPVREAMKMLSALSLDKVKKIEARP